MKRTEDTGGEWDDEQARAVGAAYASAQPADRARILRAYIGAAAHEDDIPARKTYADALALLAGYTDEEVERLRHLTDGAAPAAGWSIPTH